MTTCKKYKVTAGRIITCKDTGADLFGISREIGLHGKATFSPTETDAMAHYIVNVLNKRKDFEKFYKKYMK